MAVNRIYPATEVTTPALAFVGPHANANQLPLTGDPCILGQLPAFAADNPDANNLNVGYVDGIFMSNVKGEGADMAAGAVVYFDATDDACPLNDDNTGVRFGITLDAVAHNATTKVRVWVGK